MLYHKIENIKQLITSHINRRLWKQFFYHFLNYEDARNCIYITRILFKASTLDLHAATTTFQYLFTVFNQAYASMKTIL